MNASARGTLLTKQ